MSPTTLPRLLLAASMVALLGGCSILGSSEKTAVTLYSPSVQVKPDPAWPQASWQLVLAKPSAARMVDSPRINVRPTPSQLEIYKGASWAQPATDMIEDTLLRGFEDSGRIGAVARIATGIRSDYKLATDLRRFESDYRGGEVPAATIELNAKLIHSIDQRVVAARTFVVIEPASSTDIASVASAFETALNKTTTDLVGWTLLSGQRDAATQSGPKPAGK